jgi:hypothetical protein
MKASCGCWLYLGAHNRWGYGNVYVGGGRANPKFMPAHRYAWEEKHGKIPIGLELDHRICRVKCCVNPEHMVLCTKIDNIKQPDGGAGKQMSKTHCVNGHEYTANNIYRHYGWRVCKTCVSLKSRAKK